jgi:5-aminopentanamidase
MCKGGVVKIAAWQMPIRATAASEALAALSVQLRRCETAGVSVLCCPEAAVGGLADYFQDPDAAAIETADVDATFAPIASATVTTIVGFTERGRDGHVYNAAAVVRRGSVSGIYRKVYPAINRSVYEPGRELPVFQAEELTFGIVICNDSNYFEPARVMAAKGAAVLFVPTNNSLPLARSRQGLVDEARACDIARAVDNTVWVVRADVAGRTATHARHSTSPKTCSSSRSIPVHRSGAAVGTPIGIRRCLRSIGRYKRCDDRSPMRRSAREVGGIERGQRDRRPAGYCHLLQCALAVPESNPVAIRRGEQPEWPACEHRRLHIAPLAISDLCQRPEGRDLAQPARDVVPTGAVLAHHLQVVDSKELKSAGAVRWLGARGRGVLHSHEVLIQPRGAFSTCFALAKRLL